MDVAKYDPEAKIREALNEMALSGWYETAEDVGEDAIEVVKVWMGQNEEPQRRPFRANTYGSIYSRPYE